MKLFSSLWVLVDNESMDVTQIEFSPSPADNTLERMETALTQQPVQPRYDYSNIINFLDYIKIKNPAY